MNNFAVQQKLTQHYKSPIKLKKKKSLAFTNQSGMSGIVLSLESSTSWKRLSPGDIRTVGHPSSVLNTEVPTEHREKVQSCT